MKIHSLYFGNVKFGAICINGPYVYVTCTSIRNHWLRARRLDRVALDTALKIYKIKAFGIDVVSLDDFKLILATLLARYDHYAKMVLVAYLNKCYLSGPQT